MHFSREQIEEQNTELERLKRSLHAKEEVERSQIEAVHTLTAKTKKQEKEILTLQEKLDNTVHKMEAYKKSLDAAKMWIYMYTNYFYIKYIRLKYNNK